jgi:hypothetical protein
MTDAFPFRPYPTSEERDWRATSESKAALSERDAKRAPAGTERRSQPGLGRLVMTSQTTAALRFAVILSVVMLSLFAILHVT